MPDDQSRLPRLGRQPMYRDDQLVTVIPNATKTGGREMKPGMHNHDLFEKVKELAPCVPSVLRAAGVPSGYLKYFIEAGLVSLTESVSGGE